jgi:plastocyanin
MLRVHVLAGVFVAALLAACGGGDDGGIIQPDRPPGSVSIVSGAETRGTAAFSPNPITVSLNGAVRWYNDDVAAGGGQYGGSSGTTHTITADDGISFSSPNIIPRGTFQHTFATAGNFPYHCSLHPTMRGTLTVTP